VVDGAELGFGQVAKGLLVEDIYTHSLEIGQLNLIYLRRKMADLVIRPKRVRVEVVDGAELGFGQVAKGLLVEDIYSVFLGKGELLSVGKGGNELLSAH
ncbi:MAG: hypothetical protein AAFO83_11765, partial [Cyanobacteria bacterium J06607_13]